MGRGKSIMPCNSTAAWATFALATFLGVANKATHLFILLLLYFGHISFLFATLRLSDSYWRSRGTFFVPGVSRQLQRGKKFLSTCATGYLLPFYGFYRLTRPHHFYWRSQQAAPITNANFVPYTMICRRPVSGIVWGYRTRYILCS